jgi:hypothetical protein
MKPEKQRIAVAEACGWTVSANGWWSHPTLPDNGGAMPDAPDYLNDLNAMHEAEKVLTQQQRIEYVRDLGYIWTGRNDRALPNWWFVHDATAAQRARAFLRTIGKWEDEV